jgi:coproporphyrinogen III oxidase-like Fe-S oxidoreductase
MDLILQDSWRKANYKEIHLGGGTHIFFYKNLEDLINGILFMLKKAKDHEFSLKAIRITQLTNICKSYMI